MKHSLNTELSEWSQLINSRFLFHRPSGPLQSRLPAIPSATPPLGGDNNWLVPVNRGDDKGFRSEKFTGDDDRMFSLETRLGVTEKSNRALMEEVIRLHSDLRLSVRKNQENIKVSLRPFKTLFHSFTGH